MISEARPHAKSRLASGWRPCNGASTCGGAQGMAGAQGCRCRALGHRGAQPQAAGTSNPPTLGGGTPHHRFLASHPRSWGPAGCRLQGGGGNAAPQVLGVPCMPAAPHQEVVGGWAAGGGRPHHRLLAAGRGGGGAAPQVFGVPCMPAAPHQEVVGGWAAGGGGGASPQVVGQVVRSGSRR